MQPADRLLVAGDDARRKDHDIALFERDVGVVVAGDAGQRGARLALAAGADQQDLVARDVAGLVLGQKARHIGEIAVLARRLVHPPQRAADQRHVAAMRRARHAAIVDSRATLEAKQATATRAVIAADQLGQRLAAIRPRSRDWPGFSALVESQTIASTPSSPTARSRASSVGVADQRLGIELPVAGVQHGAGRGADHHRVRLGDRMGQGDQFEIERADREAARHRHDVDRDLVERAAPRPAWRAAARR